MKLNKGISLITLIITIIVLVILTGAIIATVTGQNSVIELANKSVEISKNVATKEQEIINKIDDLLKKQEILPGTVTVTGNNASVILTKDNVCQYLGKKVTNYTGQNKVEIGGKEYEVSTEYRLYYVDFDGKYDGTGTIYLKAECISKPYGLPVTDTSPDTDENIKIRTLNPALYKNGVTSVPASSFNMKAVTWLLNANNWADLADTSMKDNINYIVGSPSVEIMMDSYNKYYESAEDRYKLYYKYESGNLYGYKVCDSKDTTWTWSTSSDAVGTDPDIDSMYYPGKTNYYWLSSPTGYNNHYNVMTVWPSTNGRVYYDSYFQANSLCPLVSLKPNTVLQLETETEKQIE